MLLCCGALWNQNWNDKQATLAIQRWRTLLPNSVQLFIMVKINYCRRFKKCYLLNILLWKFTFTCCAGLANEKLQSSLESGNLRLKVRKFWPSRGKNTADVKYFWFWTFNLSCGVIWRTWFFFSTTHLQKRLLLLQDLTKLFKKSPKVFTNVTHNPQIYCFDFFYFAKWRSTVKTGKKPDLVLPGE